MTVFKYFIFVFVGVSFISGCISNILKAPAPTFSNHIQLPTLSAEFAPQKISAYPSWKSNRTSNVILVISECSDQSLSLSSAHSLITSSIENEKVLEEKKTTFKNGAAYYRKVSGLIDDHNIDIVSLSFKYKDCIYISSLSGVRESLSKDLDTWAAFNQQIEFKK